MRSVRGVLSWGRFDRYSRIPSEARENLSASARKIGPDIAESSNYRASKKESVVTGYRLCSCCLNSLSNII